MRFLVVDDEELALRDLVEVLGEARADAQIVSFLRPSQALEYAGKCRVDVAFLDIELGVMSGIYLAKQLKDLQPQIHIIFVTSYEKYAVEAFSVHATGYLLKPAAVEEVRRELEFLYPQENPPQKIWVKTFGGFDVYVDGRAIVFRRAKAKELLAYLVDRRGSCVTLKELSNILFEDGTYDLARKKYLQTIYADLRTTLREADAEQMLAKTHNSYGVDVGSFSCDSYRFLAGDPIAVNSYRRDYMASYSWAEFTMGEME